MGLLTGVALLAAFLVVVAMIVRGQSPIIMLLILAIVWAVFAGIGAHDIQAKILQGGGVQFASAVIIIVFGAWFAPCLKPNRPVLHRLAAPAYEPAAYC